MKGQFPIAAVFITVAYDMVDINVYPTKADIASGFQEAVADVPAYKIINAAKQKACRHIAIAGGIAANRRLREKVAQDASKEKFDVYIPSLKLCDDNAAMIASTGWHYLKAGKVSLLDTDVYSRLRI